MGQVSGSRPDGRCGPVGAGRSSHTNSRRPELRGSGAESVLQNPGREAWIPAQIPRSPLSWSCGKVNECHPEEITEVDSCALAKSLERFEKKFRALDEML